MINVAYAIGMRLYSDKANVLSAPVVINPEKIVLLPTDESCLEWGNFYEEQIHYAETVISEIAPDQSYTLEEAGNTLMHWLYIPPFPNKETANRMINKLRNLGIVSFRIKDENQWKNAISLGMLYDKEDALKQLKEIEKKGIANAKIEDRSVMLKKIVIHGSTEEIKVQVQRIVEQFDGTQLIQSKCEH